MKRIKQCCNKIFKGECEEPLAKTVHEKGFLYKIGLKRPFARLKPYFCHNNGKDCVKTTCAIRGDGIHPEG